MRGALVATGSTACLFADLCQELDTPSIHGGGVAPSATEYTCSACAATVWSELPERSGIATTWSIMDTLLGDCTLPRWRCERCHRRHAHAAFFPPSRISHAPA